ncbi:hypothetical protein VTL71DRAFT_9175 [Oculimacula yallundae]|uniref:Polyketide synthase n=1 Tax=Oculimacula yallundae TaxID=86028 RepID=A0ABR4BSB2_9HELO
MKGTPESRTNGHEIHQLEDDPVVVCGMAMRLPGNVSNGQEFWDMLIEKRCGSGPVPKSRFNAEGYYSQHPRPGTLQMRQAYFMDHVDLDRFDASHFPFSRKEIEAMDPCQRQLLEITWECLENAGETDWHGKNVGCYVGSFMEDWGHEVDRDTQNFSSYPGGKWDIMLANRVSYAYDFHGPSMTIRTGCSATLVGLNLAEQAVKSGECSSAIVAGCNIFLSAVSATMASYGVLGNVLSEDGTCKTFDAECDGYGRGEAINAVYIKRLSHALRDGNPIRAIIRSTATQHDGKKPGLLNPNSYAQEALIRHTYKIAGITDYSQTAFFECHGTGTAVGDPTEVSAVERIFGKSGIVIGGVKPNIGHSEGAAALSSVIKVVLMLERGIIAPNINFKKPNPNIPWADGRIKVLTEAQPFPPDRLKRVSVNSFGIGGTNSHAILEAYEGPRATARNYQSSPAMNSFQILLFSASNPRSLELQQNAYKKHIADSSPNLEDLAYTLGCRRTHLNYRSFMIVKNPNVVTEPESCGQDGNLKLRKRVFVFNGQGAQWPTMGKTLIESNSTFRKSIQRLDNALSLLPSPPNWKIEDELTKNEKHSRVMESEYSLPCSTAVQIGIVNVLRGWSVSPDAVVGHSSGEIAGAYAVGALTAEEAIIVAYFRGKIPKSMGTPKQGNMAALGLSARDVERFLVPGVVVSCENSQKNTTISGDKCEVEAIVDRVKQEGFFARLLTVDRAYHSQSLAHMETYGPAYEDAIRPYTASTPPKLPFFSSVTGERVTSGKLDAQYWHRSLVQPVRFDAALRRLLQTYGQTTNPVFIEIGAHPALKGPIKQILEDFPNISACHIPTLKHGSSCIESLLRTAGNLFCENIPFDSQVVTPPGRVLTNLPQYCWAHEDLFQAESRLFIAYRDSPFPMHDLLGRQNFESSALEPTWRKVLLVEENPWLGDHMINGQIIFPFAAYLSIAEEALRQVSGGMLESFSASNFTVTAAMHLEKAKIVEIHTSLRRVRGTEKYAIRITSWKGGVWTEHCHALIASGPFPNKPRKRTERREFTRTMSKKEWYKIVQDRGFLYGPAFRGLENISVDPCTPEATAQLHPFVDTTDYLIHPTALDQCFQLLVIAGCHGQQRKAKYVSMPTSVEDIFISRSSGPFWTTATANSSTLGEPSGELLSYSSEGQQLLSMKGVKVSQIATTAATDHLPLLSTALWDHHSSFHSFITPDESECLSDALRVLTHTNPQLRILEIGNGSDALTRKVLTLLGPGQGKMLFKSYTYSALSTEILDNAQCTLADYPSFEFELLDSLCDEQTMNFQSNRYDIILLTADSEGSPGLGPYISRLRDLLCPSGFLIRASLLQNGSVTETKPILKSLLPMLSASGFDPITTSDDRDLAKTEILRPSAAVHLPRVHIVTSHQGHELVDRFKDDLERLSIPMTASVISDQVPEDRTLVYFVDLISPYIYNLTESQYTTLIGQLSEPKRPIVWVTTRTQTNCKDPRQSMIHGLARTLRSELKIDITVVELDVEADDHSKVTASLLRIIQHLPQRQFSNDIGPDFEFLVEGCAIKVPRFHWSTTSDELSRCSEIRTPRTFCRLTARKPRQIESIHWVNYPLESIHSSHVRVEVMAAVVDHHDVNTAKTIVDPRRLTFGQEGSGIITEVGDQVKDFRCGDKVMFLRHGATSSHIDLQPASCMKLSGDTAMELAASLPSACTAASLAVHDFGKIQANSIVLLPFVQSNTHIAVLKALLFVQAKIYATVESEADQTVLEKKFGILRDQIISVKSMHSSLKTALGTGQADFCILIGANQQRELLPFLSASATLLVISESCSGTLAPPKLGGSQAYRIVNVRELALDQPSFIERAFTQVKDWFPVGAQEDWVPPHEIFDPDQCCEAFQSTALGIPGQATTILRTPTAETRVHFPMSSSAAEIRFRSDTSYLLVGGLGGLGRAISTWMVENGARELIYLSRSATEGPDTSPFFAELRRQGCRVKVVAGSVTKFEDVTRAIGAATGAISGVIQMSMVLRDNAVQRMSFKEWKECVEPKVEGTLNLHKALLNQELDFFLLFSSMSGVIGQIGQANYNSANAFLDSFVSYRHGLGLPASVIDIGVMGGIGVVAQTENMELRAKAAGYHILSEQDLLACITTSIFHSQPNPDPTTNKSHLVLGLWSDIPLADPSTHVLWKRDVRMSMAYTIDGGRGKPVSSGKDDGVEAIVLIAKTAPSLLGDDATVQLIVKHLGHAISELLAQPDVELPPTAMLDDIGLDSLNAIELSGWVAQYLSVDLPLFELMHTPTLWDLAVKISELMYEEFA